ncbi:50S ribosomal protein L24 [Haloplanus rubicundus]|jgi:large subunit ribosomal protein L24|uniref:Large ribosomal subunit protein uL24 n=1 Tax=Haloplanus rubicundus TaxID=1547898 RepID=A0A345E5Z8_9EURY|nr:50S ribosomal protein L24 [Haloplanus rubicundus]AXG07620.1 50S ribosomal protein L24 [Haloplanus rubicundus]AXG11035.1 50S ribosomal protein L24 [Haloplanus rubicundus]
MTRQPRKQRTQTRNAPLHERHDQVRSTLADDLREQYGQRSVRVNAGDTVEVLRGDHAGEEAEVIAVDLADEVVHVEGVTVEKADGEEVPRPLDASNLRVTDLDLEDDRRRARLEEDSE